MIKTGSQILVDALIREGAEYVFGIPGGAVLPLFDALFESPIKFILTRHEQGAGHAKQMDMPGLQERWAFAWLLLVPVLQT